MILTKVKHTFFWSIICFLLTPVSPAMASTVTEHFIFEAKEISFSLLILSLLILLYTVMRLLEYRRVVEKKTEALKESEERYALAANGANDGLWDWDLKSDEIYLSSRWKTMVGYEENKTITKPSDWFALVHSDDIENLKNNIAAHLRGRTDHLENEYRIQHQNGSYLWMLCRGLAVKTGEGEAIRIAGSQTDITERKKAEEQLIYDAFHDALTGLPNRALFIDHLDISFVRKKRKKDYKFAVLFLDLDRFKNINDTFGHLFGNRLLAEVAKRLDASLREGDTFARFGGDEFAILLDDIANTSYVVPIAERISEELSLPFEIDGQKVFITASMGIAASNEYNRPEDILRDADIAMYKAKFAGRACHVMFDEVMRSEVSNLLQLETDLRYAIQNKEFMIYYQPIISIETERIAGFEALLRWYHQKRGFVPATEIIPLAEETGLIIPIEDWVISEACRQILQW
jgi:diguanylate cyclase (GGDEF)-like protein/PAS domain S-box-containing protein